MALAEPRGAVLLEAVVALAILGIVGGAGAWTASESLRTLAHVRQAEAHMRSATRFLTAVSLWPRADLDRHLGSTAQGTWTLRVDRPRPTLYEVSLTETSSGAVLLETALHRGMTDQ